MTQPACRRDIVIILRKIYPIPMFKHILFDVDHTLYPKSSNMEAEMIRRINCFVSSFLNIPVEKAAEMRNLRDPMYDSTLNWLQRKYKFNDEISFFKAIHPTDFENYFAKNPELVKMMSEITVPCSIFTNSWAVHAKNVIGYLEIERFFKKIYDLPFCGFKGKPALSAFKAVLDDLKLESSEVLIVDDSVRTVSAYISIGGKAVLVDEEMDHKEGSSAPAIREITELRKFSELFAR